MKAELSEDRRNAVKASRDIVRLAKSGEDDVVWPSDVLVQYRTKRFSSSRGERLDLKLVSPTKAKSRSTHLLGIAHEAIKNGECELPVIH